jgi:hypothetical protein
MMDPKSEESSALADESLNVLQKPKDKTRAPVLRRVQDLTEEHSEVDALSPAKGIIRAIGLSVILWGLIILVTYWIRLSL